MKNIVSGSRITSLYGSQPSSVVFTCKTVTFGPELQVSMGTTPHLSFCARKTARLAPQLLVSSLYGFQSSSVLFGYTTVTFGPE